MKRLGNIFDSICSIDNILRSIEKAAKGKHKRESVSRVLQDPYFYALKIQEMLINESFSTSPYQTSIIACSGKERLIYKLPFFPDRIIHHCIVGVIEPYWISIIIRDTYASIPGRGVHDGVRRIKRALQDRPNTQYCLKLDIKKFYPSIDHEVLKAIVRKKLKDKRVLKLIDEVIDSTEGLPIGNYLSQWLGNIMLDGLDHYCKETLLIKYYFRYCDDIIVLSSSKDELRRYFLFIDEYAGNLKLQIKGNYQIFPVSVRGIDFLGYRFFHFYTLVRKRIVTRFKRSLKVVKNHKILPSYWGWFKHANTFRLTKKYYHGNIRSKNGAVH